MQSKRRNWSKRVPWIALIALYGAVLSTYQLLDSRAEKARHLDVSLYFDAPIAKGVQYPKGLVFKAMNPGYREVTVAGVGLILPDGSRKWFVRGSDNWQFPNSIAPGDNGWILLGGHDLATICDYVAHRAFTITFNGTVPLIGFCQDGEGRVYESAPLQLNIEDALKLARAQATSPKVRENQRHSQQ